MDIDSCTPCSPMPGARVLLSLDDIVLTARERDDQAGRHRPGPPGDTEAEVEINAMKTRLGECIDRIPKREKLVISLYYYDGLTFKEIGKILGVSESRVYQLRTQAIVRLRGYLQRDVELLQV